MVVEESQEIGANKHLLILKYLIMKTNYFLITVAIVVTLITSCNTNPSNTESTKSLNSTKITSQKWRLSDAWVYNLDGSRGVSYYIPIDSTGNKGYVELTEETFVSHSLTVYNANGGHIIVSELSGIEPSEAGKLGDITFYNKPNVLRTLSQPGLTMVDQNTVLSDAVLDTKQAIVRFVPILFPVRSDYTMQAIQIIIPETREIVIFSLKPWNTKI